MNDFEYNLAPYDSGAPLPAGTASYSSNSLYISPTNAAGVDKTAEIRSWLAQAQPNLPILLEVTYEVPGNPETVTELVKVDIFTDRLDDVGNGLPALLCLLPFGIGGSGSFDSGTISFDFATPPVAAPQECGGQGDSPCPPNTYCFAEECVPVTDGLRDDDVLLVSDGGVLYHVKSSNYQATAAGKTTVVVRDGKAYNCPALGANLLDSDTLLVWRPSAKRNYSLSGKQFKNQFS